jgi:hypothetical protein
MNLEVYGGFLVGPKSAQLIDKSWLRFSDAMRFLVN